MKRLDHLELNEGLRLESERFVKLRRLKQFNFVAFGSLGADLRRYRAVELHGAVQRLITMTMSAG